MGGGAAEMVFLGDAPPTFMVSDMLSANAIAGIVATLQVSRRSSNTAIKKRWRS